MEHFIEFARIAAVVQCCRCDVQPDLVALGKPGGIAVLHGAGDGCAVVRRGIGGGGFRGVCSVGDGDSEHGGRVGAVARGSIIERVVAGAGCCQHQECQQYRCSV